MVEFVISIWGYTVVTAFIYYTMDSNSEFCAIKKFPNYKGGNYSYVLPFKAARRDSISNLTSFGLQIWAADEPNTFGVESLWGAKLMPLRGCAIDWDDTK